MPRPIWQPQAWVFLSALGLALGAGALLNLWAGRRRRATGKTFPAFLASLAALVLLPLLASLLSGPPAQWDIPLMGGFNFRGGFTILPEFLAMCAAMTIYMGAFIGENIRAGIEAVPRGQLEAAAALGLRQSKILRLVVIPQAMRVIIPPVTSQYLTLAKNMSLGVVIGYPDIVSVFAGTTLNQTGQAVEVVAMTMGTYLALSVLISLFMNWYNTRFILVEH
jgi:general L-amino acid transport system permease protein